MEQPTQRDKDMKHILIVDDSNTMRQMVKISLRTLKEYVTFEEAENGFSALERLALVHVDMMILDLNMPDMHGTEVLRLVRQHKTFHAIPILVLTTRSDQVNHAAAMEAGASFYLTKPFEPKVLARHVQELLGI
jgi:CheY-like chemotaxis protein